ncbi:MAG: glutathione S-transferase N-terminal domain-containing protein [Candidatus Diapherotrites archaeon]|nr:glutathione S-transferase N-terminal domain-containing protein [Candidatus Diapherotrites archaeon]
MRVPQVIVYSTKTCPYCHLAKEFLKANSVKFEDVDVGANVSRAMEMIQKSGQQGVPVIDIDGKIIIGFDREAIKKALHLA